MKNKLDPRQYNPYGLETPSGNLSFSELTASFQCFLLENLSGDFSFTGNYLKFNGGSVIHTDVSNNVGNNNSVISSFNSFATGSNNLIVGSNSSEISGSNNLILGGQDNQVDTADFSAILFGRNAISNHTGSCLIADTNGNRSKSSTEVYSLTIDFESGLFVKNDSYFNGDIYSTGGNVILNGNIHVDELSSGLFSGDINVLQNAYKTGSPLQNLQDLIDSSGSLRDYLRVASGLLDTGYKATSGVLNQTIANSGALAQSNLLSTSGALRDDLTAGLNNSVNTTGAQSIGGIKDFNASVNFNFPATGNDFNITGDFQLGGGRFIPTAHNSIGRSGQISFDETYFYVCTGNNAWARLALGGW